MTTHEEITEIIEDMDLNRPYNIHISDNSETQYVVKIYCDTHHLSRKVFQAEFNRISAKVNEFVCTLDYVEFQVNCYE